MKQISHFMIVMVFMLLVGMDSDAGMAQERPGLTMQAEAAYQGFVKYGEWLPIWVTLENSGPDLDGEVQVSITGGSGSSVYAVSVPMPSGARKRVPVYIIPNNFSYEVEAQYVVGGDAAGNAKATVWPRMNSFYFTGVISEERGALSLLSALILPSRVNRTFQLVDVALAELPDRTEALRSFDTLILNDVDTSNLSNEQKAALEGWVRMGGRLVLGGGPGAARTLSGLPEVLVPMAPGNLLELDDLPELAAYAQTLPIRAPGPFLVTAGEARAGRTVVQQDGVILLQEAGVGVGVVDFIALDLAGYPFDAWTGTTSFWEQLLTPGSAYPDWLPPDVPARQMKADQMNYALSNLPALDLPSVRVLAFLLGFYVVLVGPVNYYVLRWRNRLHWAWLTIPVITLVFTGGTFTVGYAMKGSDVILNKLSLVELRPDGSAQTTTYFGLFSPAQQAYHLRVNGGYLLSPISQTYDPWGGSNPNIAQSSLNFLQGDPAVVRGLSVGQWSMQSFQSEAVWSDFGVVFAEMRFGTGELSGTIRNGSRYTLRDAVLVMGTRFTRLGDIPAGQAVESKLEIQEQTGFTYMPEIGWLLFESEYSQSIGQTRALDVKRTMINAVFQNGGYSSMVSSRMPISSNSGSNAPVLLAWLDEAPPEVEVVGRTVQRQSTALVYMQLPFEFGDQAEIMLPAGMLSGQLIRLPIEGGTCGPSGTSVWLGRGEAEFEFEVPDSIRDYEVDTLRVLLRSDGGWWQAPQIALYAWDTENWVVLDGSAIGVNLVGNGDRYVHENGKIQARLSTDSNQGGGCLYLDMGLEGTRH
jgi:hypothetical protein